MLRSCGFPPRERFFLRDRAPFPIFPAFQPFEKMIRLPSARERSTTAGVNFSPSLVPVIALLTLSSVLCAEPIATPFGVFDPEEEDAKISYNVETEDGVETKTKVVKSADISDQFKVKSLAKRLKAKKFVIAPKSTESITETVATFQYRRAEAKETAQQVRVRRYNNAKSKIQEETRKFYKNRIPNAVAPMGSFINEGGGSMTLVDKNKKPIGTLIIAYKTDMLPLPSSAEDKKKYFPNSNIPYLGEAEFFIVSQIPAEWSPVANPSKDCPRIPLNFSCYVLPSGEKVLVRKEGKFYRCTGFATRVTITYSYEKLSRSK